MHYDVTGARYLAGYALWLEFRDGTTGDVDLGPYLTGPVFEPLKDLARFREFRVHPEFQTLVWPDGADLAPEFLYGLARR